MKLGLDIGTKNIVLCYNDPQTEKLRFRREINGYYKIKNDSAFAKNMLIQAGVPFIEQGGYLVALGAKAEEIAHAFNKTLRRPMKDGVLCQGEDDAISIMSIIIQNLIGYNINEDIILYYCVPAKAINTNINTDFHSKVMSLIMNGYESKSGNKITSFKILEGHALALTSENKTCIAISCGAGAINVCYCLFGLPIYSFSWIGSGDWIDLESARQFGYNSDRPDGDYKYTPTSVSRIKEMISLKQMPDDSIGRTIYINYKILIDNIIDGVIKGFNENENKARIDKPIPIIVAGGTSMPDGFVDLFKDQLSSKNIPFKIGEIIRPERPLFAVSEGCFNASKMHSS